MFGERIDQFFRGIPNR